jgi:hypothetical protein
VKRRAWLLLLMVLQAQGFAEGDSRRHGVGDYGGVLDIPAGVRPQVIFATPRAAEATADRLPLYLHVPREQADRWTSHCRHYSACGHPVWFVSDEWYYGIFRGRGLPPAADPEEHLAP